MRWPKLRERLHSRKQERFDPVAEGARHGLAPELSRAIWHRVSTDGDRGARGEDVGQARRRFQEIAAHMAARGLQLAPCAGKRTRAEVESGPDRIITDWLKAMTIQAPGRRTRVETAAAERTHLERSLGVDRAAVNRTGNPARGGDGGDEPPQLERAAECRAATLYRRASDAGEVAPEDPAVEAALASAGSGSPLSP